MYLITCLLSLVFSVANTQNDVQKLVASMLASTPLEEDLQELCDEIGGRVTGSPANEKAVEWAFQKLTESGVKTWKDPFTMPVYWDEDYCQAYISTLEFRPHMVAKYQSPPGVYEGRLIFVEDGRENALAALGKEKLRDQFILVETELCLDVNGLFAEYAHAAQVELAAMNYGVKGIVFMASRPDKLLYRFLTMKGVENELPQLVMSRIDAKRCIRALQQGKELHLQLQIEAKTGSAFTAHNVIAEIPGTDRSDEVIVIGSHIDSWALGTGANDNGCNVSMMIDIARQMQALGIRPRRTIRIALWNGEEQGFFGSWDYVKDHRNELDNHKMAMSIDIGSGAINGFFTNGRSELVPVVDQLLTAVEGLGNFTQINVPIVGTDNFDFMLQGVPNLVGSHLPQVYGINYHASTDTYDKVDLKQLKVNSAIVAALTLGFANLPDEVISTLKRQSRSEIQKIFDDTNLEFTMRMFNVWEPWISGLRGRLE